ncbi:MAG: amidohydrolase family protein [Anaerolineae bacterium]
MDEIYRDILGFVNGLEIVDTHEHVPGDESCRGRDTDVLCEYLTHYFSRDLICAGLSEAGFARAIDHRLPLMERWDIVEPYWEVARYTGYGRSLDITARGLYGIDGISRGTIEALDEAFQRGLAPGHYAYVLKEKSRIRTSLLDSEGPCDETFFRRVVRLDHFIFPRLRDDVVRVETESDSRVCSVEDWLDACTAAIERLPEQHAVALKTGLAYERSLRYDRVTRQQAEEAFNTIFATKHFPDWGTVPLLPGREFHDYMMHFILRQANRRHLTVQVHTGLQESSGNLIYHSDPALLSNLFLEYPDVDFDIFHIGYPYQHVLSALAKMFPNVYIDMCWAHIISPVACVDALVEWLDAVPANKICAFGGDYGFVDGIYGHQYLARMNVSKALAIKVRDGVFGVDRAQRIAEMLFVDNPTALFGLERGA